MGLNVLIIDDDEDFSEGLVLILRKKGHIPIIAHTAIEGLKIAKEQQPEVILLDLLLPGMDGVIALELFRHDVPNIPIIVISGLEKDNPKAKVAISSGIKAYLKKPFQPKTLFDTLTEIDINSSSIPKKQTNIVILGLSGAGKTSLINRFIRNSFSPSSATLGVDLEYYYGENGIFRLIDLAGQKSFRDFLWKENVKLADAIVYVFDLSSTDIFYNEAIDWFWKSVNDWAKKDAPILFIGNKSDLEGLNVFDVYKLFDLSKLSQTKHNFQIMQTSAKTGENVSLAFSWLLERFDKENKKLNLIESLILFNKENKEIVTCYNYSSNDPDLSERTLVNLLTSENAFTFPENKITDFYHLDRFIIILTHSRYVLVVISNSSTSALFIEELQRIFNYLVNTIVHFDQLRLRNEKLGWLLKTEFRSLLIEEKSLEMSEDDLYIIVTEWDKSSGGKLLNLFPKNISFNVKNIISTCFMTKFGIYGFQEQDTKPTMLSIPIVYERPGFDARILFDRDKQKNDRMFAIITLYKNVKLNIYEHNKYLVDYLSKTSTLDEWNDNLLHSFYKTLQEKALLNRI